MASWAPPVIRHYCLELLVTIIWIYKPKFRRYTVNKVNVPAELRLKYTRQCINKSDEPLLNVITKCGRYCEPGIQLLCTIESGATISQHTLYSLFLAQHAKVKYLQEGFAALLVNGQFNTSTANIFRNLKMNT